jgi:hypothetical protein
MIRSVPQPSADAAHGKTGGLIGRRKGHLIRVRSGVPRASGFAGRANPAKDVGLLTPRLWKETFAADSLRSDIDRAPIACQG